MDLNSSPRRIEVLPEHLAGDRYALERLFREARAASATERAGICTIYEIGAMKPEPFSSDGGSRATALAALEGGAIPFAGVVDLRSRSSGALDHAHGVAYASLHHAGEHLPDAAARKLLDFASPA